MHESTAPAASARSLAWQGMGAAALITIASWGVGWFPRNQLSELARTGFFIQFRTDLAGVLACIAAMAVGIAWLIRTWLHARPGVGPAGDTSEPQLRRLLIAWSAPLLLSFPILSRDVYSYLAQGRMLHAGKSPYFEGISALPGWFASGPDGLWAQSPSPYGALFLVAARAVYFISGGIPEVGVGLMRVLALAGVIGCYQATIWLARRLGRNPRWAAWAIVGNPLFLLTMIGGVHNDGLMIAATFWAFGLALGRRRWAATLALAVAVSIKPIVLVLLPFLGLALLPANPSLRARIGTWTSTSLMMLLWLGLVGAATGLWFGWLPAMLTSGSAAFPYAPVGLLGTSLGWLGGLLGLNGGVISSVVFTVFRLASLYLVARLALARDTSRPLALAARALCAVVLLAPIIQPWYILWLFALFLIAGRVPPRRETLMIQLSVLITLVVFVDQLSIEQWHVIWLLKALAGILLAGLLLVLWRRDPLARRLLTGAGGTAGARETDRRAPG